MGYFDRPKGIEGEINLVADQLKIAPDPDEKRRIINKFTAKHVGLEPEAAPQQQAPVNPEQPASNRSGF